MCVEGNRRVLWFNPLPTIRNSLNSLVAGISSGNMRASDSEETQRLHGQTMGKKVGYVHS